MTFFFMIPVLGNLVVLYFLDVKFPRSRKGEGLPNIAMAILQYMNYAQYRGVGSITGMVGFTVFQLGILEIGTFTSSFILKKLDNGSEEATPAKEV